MSITLSQQAQPAPADLQDTAGRIESGEITNAHFSHRNLVMCSKEHYAALVDSSAAPAVQPLSTETPRLLANVADAARRLLEHADFQLGGILSADSKAKDIPSKAVSQVKARHLASLRDRVAELDLDHGIAAPGSKP